MKSKKCVWILSPERWGAMRLSKHHYAVALSALDWEVFFINPPNEKRDTVTISKDAETGITVVDHSFFFPYLLKFHARRVFDLLLKQHIKKLIARLEIPDLVWSFDIGGLYNLKHFPKQTKKIAFAADFCQSQFTLKNTTQNADLIVSVAQEILNDYPVSSNRKKLVPHGVSDVFLNSVVPDMERHKQEVHVGMSGNFLRPDIDYPTLLKIINSNPHCNFHLFGSYLQYQSNVGGGSNYEVTQFINELCSSPNVRFYGPLEQKDLVKELAAMDAFLVCYDVAKDQSKGTNYHKIAEYLALGKVILSNSVSAYQDTDLFLINSSRNNNHNLPVMFQEMLADLDGHNSFEMRQARRALVAKHSYSNLARELLQFVGF